MHVRVAVIGTGVIGTSIGLALKAAGAPVEIVGHDRNFERARRAQRLGAFDRTEWNLIRAVESADFIVLALPAYAIRPTLEAIRQDLRPGAVVTDTANVKGAVLRWATELLPPGVHFVGGHPLVHAPAGGPEVASAELFRFCRYCVVPAATTESRAVDVVVNFVELLGATPLFIDPEEHDALAALAYHLPEIIVLALLSLIARMPSWWELWSMVGPQYATSPPLLEVNPADVREHLFANREKLVQRMNALVEELSVWKEILQRADEAAFDDRFARLRDAFARWQAEEEKRRQAAEEIRRYGDFISLLLGVRSPQGRRKG